MIYWLVLVSSVVSVIVATYLVVGAVGTALYLPESADSPAENVRFVVTTVATEAVDDALCEVLQHTTEQFPQYELFVVVDEGSDLESQIRAHERVRTVVVPDSFSCNATAKGRAMEYFTRTVVSEAPEYWYAFLDDDNLVLDRSLLYEIPYYEERGYRAANPVLVPRPGDSTLTFVMDHLRTLDDFTVFRTFTGLLGKPLIGFHGELLTVRGDVLADIGFDRQSLVEDYAFAARLVERDIPTWQTSTRVSILSPHTLRDLYRQRRRWFLGLVRELFRSPLSATLCMGFRMLAWTFALVGSLLVVPVWILLAQHPFPLAFRVWTGLSSLVYMGTYVYALSRVSGLGRKLQYALLLPVYPVFEASTSLYAIVTRQSRFVVIEK